VSEWARFSVTELERAGVLLVQDGNHGNDRPRPDEFVADGVAFVRAADMSSGRVEFSSASRINDVARRRIRKGIGAPGDVLLSHKGTVGRVAAVPMNAPAFVCSPQTTFWRSLDESKLDRTFLRCFMSSPGFIAQLDSRKGETDMAPYVSLTEQRKLTVVLPPIAEQRAIAGVLGALDDKIESNRRLASRARELVSLELTAAEQESWRTVAVSDLAQFVNGGAYTKDATGTGRMVIRIAELNGGPGGSTIYNELEVPDDKVARAGDLLMSWSGSLGVYVWVRPEAIINQHIFKVIHSDYPAWLVYDRLVEAMPFFRQTAADKATTMGHIKRHHLDDAKVKVPSPETLFELDGYLRPVWDRMVLAEVEVQELASLRDALLPELLSGRLRVRDAERVVEGAV